MSKPFDCSAEFYDLIYKDKEYVKEADYVTQALSSRRANGLAILELGCGSGRHAELWAEKGFSVHGVELNAKMAELASLRSKRKFESGGSFNVSNSDIRSFCIDSKFDAVVSLFHVVSYLSSNVDVLAAFSTAPITSYTMAFSCSTSGMHLRSSRWYQKLVYCELPKVIYR